MGHDFEQRKFWFFYPLGGVKSGSNFLYALIVKDDPIVVNYFEPSVKGEYLCLNKTPFDVYEGDFFEQAESPTVIHKGRRHYYTFAWKLHL